MAGPVPTYLSTQLAAQTAFNVPFGLLALVNTSITDATAAGLFNATVDCSLFTAEDVSNLRIYLDSQGYGVEFAKDSNQKSLNIDWGKFLDIPGMTTTVNQGTSPWIVSGTVAATQSGPWTVSVASGSIEIGTVDQGHAGSESWLVDVTNTVAVTGTFFQAVQPVSGTVTANQGTSPWVVSGSIVTSPDVNIHDSAGNSLSSTGTSLDVNVTNFPATVAVTQSTSPWVVAGTIIANQGTSPWVTSVSNFPAVQTVSVNNFPATQPVSGTVTALQGTSPWVVSGTVTTSPNVNVHDGAGNAISSTGTSLDVNVTDFPASQNVVVTNTPTVNQGTNPWTVAGTIIANQGTSPWVTSVSNFPATIAVTQSTSPWVVSGTVTANAGTGNFTVIQATGTNLHTVVDSGTITLSGTSPVSGTVTANQGTPNTPANKWPMEIVDSAGVNVATVDSAGDLQVDVNNFPATVAVTQSTSPWVVSGTVTANAGTGTFLVDGSAHTQPVSGTVAVTQSTSPWVVSGTVTANAGTGNFTVVQPTGTNLHVVLDSGTLTSIANALPAGTNVIGHVITDSGSTTAVTGNVTVAQPTAANLNATVVGTVTANQGTSPWVENVSQFGGSNVVTGTGASGAGIPRVTVSNDSNVLATQSGTWTVQPGNTANTTPWLVEDRNATIASYSAATVNLVLATSPTDIFTITGSGTKTVKITKFGVSGTETTSSIRNIQFIKRSTTNSGGTSTTETAVPHDSNNAAATATVRSYTVNPTLGATVGTIRARKVDIAATNLVGSSDFVEYSFGDRAQPIVLRGTNEVLAVNMATITSAGSSFDVFVEWTEE